MRLIDADGLMNDICESLNQMTNIGIVVDGEWLWGKLNDALDNAPTIEPQKMRGKWIRNDNGTYSCSVCHSWVPEEQHYYARYCLHCGADMREG